MGTLSQMLAHGRGPRRSSGNSASKGPLRKVIDVEYRGGIPWETYECGHKAIAKEDLMGFTNATRRRCRRCLGAKRGSA